MNKEEPPKPSSKQSLPFPLASMGSHPHPAVSQEGLEGDATSVLHERFVNVRAVRKTFASYSPLGTQAAFLPGSLLCPLSYILDGGPSSELPRHPAFPLSQPQPHPAVRGGLFVSLTSPGADRVKGLCLVHPSEPQPQWAFTNTYRMG